VLSFASCFFVLDTLLFDQIHYLSGAATLPAAAPRASNDASSPPRAQPTGSSGRRRAAVARPPRPPNRRLFSPRDVFPSPPVQPRLSLREAPPPPVGVPSPPGEWPLRLLPEGGRAPRASQPRPARQKNSGTGAPSSTATGATSAPRLRPLRRALLGLRRRRITLRSAR